MGAFDEDGLRYRQDGNFMLGIYPGATLGFRYRVPLAHTILEVRVEAGVN